MNPQDELHKLTSLFPGEQNLIAHAEHIPSALTPEPYKAMLVHEHHMTVTMESYYGAPVAVELLAHLRQDPIYCRKIVLRRSDTRQVVQFGLVRFNLAYVTSAVREEILAGQTPLGRVLINQNVLRHIDLGAILRIAPGPELQALFDCTPECEIYGRLATIFCNRQPAVDLLEIPAPLDVGPAG